VRRAALMVSVMLIVPAFLTGCDGTVIYNIDGNWALGTVVFNYGDGRTWTLYDVLIEVDTGEGLIYFSGFDRDDQLWVYRGDYTRTGNRVVAEEMPERDKGDKDTLDLRLEFGSTRLVGTATNWVYDDTGDVDDVGSATLSGRRVSQPAQRDMDTASVKPSGCKFAE